MIGLARAYAQIRTHTRLSPHALARLQERRLTQLLGFASARSDFYAERLRGFDGSIESVPLLDKKTLMANLGRANTRGFDAEEIIAHCLQAETSRDFSKRFHGCTAAFSSGTSGNRGVELLSRGEEQILAALYLARFPFPPGPLRVAFILRVSSPALSRRVFGNRLIYVDPLQPTDSLVRQINAEEPTVLAAQPSVLRVLAREYSEGRLKVAPRTVVGYAEIFTPTEKEYLAATFGCQVAEIYKCTEGAIAQSCRHGRLHVNEDLLIMELRDDGAEGSAPPGSIAVPRVVVTNLTRRVLPVIRFQLNDCVEMDPSPCPCGSAFRVIASVHGRANDLLWFPRRDGEGLQLVLPDFFERAIISSSAGVEEYEVVQTGPHTVVIRIQAAKPELRDTIISSVSARLARVFHDAGCIAPGLEIEFGEVSRGPNTGKLIRVRKEWVDERDQI